ncbi:hypothetical protein EYZ11_004317 [Aspergillus tanneri]|uniref:Carrier domain-containing protein n=1 Tax=Aspergillus tanneri TaxID=1220188 RepID=A0A4S3JN63_9EURO|nr:hypothetical protein EYZ11_004317 [Aspergillus tanneri]
MTVRQVAAKKSAEKDVPAFSLIPDNLTARDDLMNLVIDNCQVSETEVEDIYPCTAWQEGQFLHQSSSIDYEFHLSVEVDRHRFQSAWEEAIFANPILRTRIVRGHDGKLWQAVLRGTIPWDTRQSTQPIPVEWRSWELGQPLMRLALSSQSSLGERLCFTVLIHHALANEHALQLLLSQVEAAYGGICLPYRPYNRFVHSLSEMPGETDDFWKDHLRNLNAVPFPKLPSRDYIPKPSAHILGTIPLERSRGDGHSIPAKLEFSWALLLSLYTQNSDVVFGMVTYDQVPPGLGMEEITGPMMTTYPLRIALDSNETVSDTLSRIQCIATKSTAFAHAGLHRISRLGFDAQQACQFQSVLHIQTACEEESSMFVDRKTLSTPAVSGVNAISLTCQVLSECVTVTVNFDPQVIQRSEVQRMLNQLRHVYQQADLSPTTRMHDMDVLSKEDLVQLQDWNGRLPVGSQYCVHEAIQEQCLARPGAPAVSAWDGSFSYGELEAQASILANTLAYYGVGPEVFVPVCFEKSRWVTVAMLGVLKAGGAVMMLDPSHPMQHLQEMCRDACTSIVLASSLVKSQVENLGLKVLVVGDHETDWRREHPRVHVPKPTSDNALFVTFTSGSTGKPKCAVNSHGSLHTNFNVNRANLRLCSQSRVLQFSSHAFDLSVAEHLWALLAGGCVCIPSEQDRMFNLQGVINDLHANWMCLTPAVARTLKPDGIPSIETLILAGEPSTTADIEMWPPGVQVLNLYGPAECAVMSTLQPDMRGEHMVNNIGHSLGAACWIVDPQNHHRLVPIGAVGELVIEGPIVGRGYLNRPDLTAAAFIDPPGWIQRFRPFPGRLYKTGDLVHHAPDGSLIYVGRKDTQVKLRGQRIELDEVAHHANLAFPGAEQAVAEVIKPESGTRPPILVAFVLCTRHRAQEPRPGKALFAEADSQACEDAAMATSRLQDRLPAYMVPAAFIPLVYVPLSRTGKLDRRLLRDRASLLSWDQIAQYVQRSVAKRSPFTQAQTTLQEMFARVLQLPQEDVGIDDNFFLLGGNSILATQLVAGMRDSGYAMTGGDLFTKPILLDLAEKLIPAGETREEDVLPFTMLPAHVSRDEIAVAATMAMDVTVAQIEDVYPSTPMQEGLMALSSKTPDAYVGTFTYDLREEIDLNRFRAAFEAVVMNNSILRSRLMYFQSQCFQVVIDERVPWDTYRNQEEYDRQYRMSNMGINARLTQLALIVEPPSFVLKIHHAMYDGQSLPILWSQVVAAYNGARLEPRPFNRFLNYLIGTGLSEQFWRSQFENLDASVFPRLPAPGYVPTPKGNLIYHIDNLPTIKTAHTLPTSIQLAWAVCLSHYTDSNDVVFGIVADGRKAPFPGIDQVSGPTLTTYPLRVLLDSGISIDHMLSVLQAQVASTFPHEHVGLQNIRKLSSEAALACDFQCQLGIQPMLEATERPLATCRTEGDLDYAAFSSYALVIVFHPQRIEDEYHVTISGNYDTDIVNAHEAQRMLEQFEHFLRYIMQHPQDKLQDIPPLSPADMRRLTEWNGALPSSLDVCLHDLVLQNCQVHPDAQAVSAWDGDWEYGELASLSSQLAHHLQANGATTGRIVPVCFEKSKWAVLAMMAILRAGAAVTAIDPKHPLERISQILSQISPPVILASATTKHLFDSVSVPVVTAPFRGVIRSKRETLRDVVSPNTSSAAPDDPAFIVFTSGSTGQPKGIVMEHRTLCTSIRDHSKPLRADQGVRGLHFASYAFDASIYEIFTILSNGGCICIPSEVQRLNGIEQFIEEHRVNWANFSPSTFRILHPDRVPSLQTVVLGGEPLTLDIAQQWCTRLTLVNGYGPAETTICAAGSVSAEGWKVGTIGPVTGGAGWITRPSDPGHLCPIGAVGELLIEGPVVTRGYLNGAAGGFIEAPDWLTRFRKGRPGRVYRTGDLVQYIADGSIRFMGRNDTQVKLRGQRIELAEVEYTVRLSFDNLNVAAEIVPLPGYAGSSALVAFVEDKENESPSSVASLFCRPTEAFKSRCQVAQTQLERTLPTYMVPSVLLPVSRLPFTTGGKLDRKRLRQAATSLSAEEISVYTAIAPSQHRQPSTAVEKIMHQVWADVLNKDPGSFGVEDSFFRLGGDSISAMQVVSLSIKSGVTVTVEQIMRCKTIALLGSALQVSTTVHHGKSHHDKLNVRFALSPVQQLFFEKVNDIVHFNQSMVLRVRNPVSATTLLQAVRSIVKKHSMLRARFHPDTDFPGNWAQIVTEGIDGSYLIQQHQGVSLDKARRICQSSHKSINIRDGPLLAVDCMAMDNGDQLMSLIVHHLVVDIVSFNIILDDLEEIIATGHPSISSSLPFSVWLQIQSEHARNMPCFDFGPHPPLDFSKLLEYWGLDGKRNCYADVDETRFNLGADETEVLFKSANDAFGTKPVELVHAALLYAFARVFPDRNLPLIWSEGHGRETRDTGADLSRTVGWFTDFWPAYVEVGTQQSLMEFVRRSKDGRRQAENWHQRQYLAAHYARINAGVRGEALDGFEILFNFSGLSASQSRPGARFQRTSLDDSPLPNLDGEATRFALFDVWAEVIDSQLVVHIISNRYMKACHTIKHWARECKEALLKLTALMPSRTPTFTKSDFPLLALTYEQLDRFQSCTQSYFTDKGLEISNAYPCSPIQRGMLLSQAKRLGDYMNNFRWRIRPRKAQAEIDISRLISAWQQLINRHPLLRTVFLESCRNDGSTDQIVLETYRADVDVIQSPERDPLQTLASYTPPPLSVMKPPHRLTVCHTENREVACLFEVSHVIVDGLSHQIILRDLKLAYDGAMESPLDHVYQEYIAYIHKQPLDTARAYWLDYLHQIEPSLFPSLPRNPDAVDERGVGCIRLSLTESSSLIAFCQANDLTIGSVFQLAWALVLKAYTSSDDVCFGYITSGRDVPITGIHDAVGPFINMLVRRIRLDQGTTLLDVLKQCQADFTRSLEFQFYSLADITHQQKHSRASPLFNTSISVQKELESYSAPESFMVFADSEGEFPTEYDVLLDIGVLKDRVLIQLQYQRTILTQRQGSHVLDAFCQATKTIIRDPGITPQELAVLGGDSETLVLQWNEQALGPVPTPQKTVSEMIHERCILQPEASAVCAWDGNLTYAELDRFSARLAAVLRQKGAGPEVFVPVCFEKSRWAIVALLGVMKAGAAFIMMDPSQPSERLRAICRTTKSHLLISCHSKASLASELGPQVIILGDCEQPWGDMDESFCLQGRAASPENALYSVFTSGSTGTPKGVVIEHRHYAARVNDEIVAYKMGPGCRIFQFVSYSWDPSIQDMLHGLVSGSCLCVPSDTEWQENLAEAVLRMQANWITMTPSLARSLNPENFPTIKTIVIGGERITRQELQLWQDRNVGVIYGPSECTPSSAHSWIHCSNTPAGILGTPFRCRCWIADPDNSEILLPIGAVGELLIEGPNVGRGYLHEPEKTSMVFIEPPSWLRQRYGSNSYRVYRSGDLAQYLEDGRLVHVRRKDLQVKVRGQRMELGEVEAHIHRLYSDLTDAIVGLIQVEDAGCRPVLVAFLHGPSTSALTDAGTEASGPGSNHGSIFSAPFEAFYTRVKELKADLRKALPVFMVPDAFVPLRCMPLSASGKADRKRIYEDAASLSWEQMQVYIAPLEAKIQPSTATEQLLQKCTAELLQISPERVGIEDNFFRLGGDSILALNLISNLQKAGHRVTMADIFSSQQLRDLAAVATTIPTASKQEPPIPRLSLLRDVANPQSILKQAAQTCHVPDDSIEDVYPCTALQEGLMVLSTKFVGKHINQTAFELAADIDLQRFMSAWNATMAANSILRTRIIQVENRRFYQVVVRDLDSWHRFLDMHEYKTHISTNTMGLGQPLINLSIVGPSDATQTHRFLLTIHHAVFDGWSMPLLWEQVEVAYRGDRLASHPFNRFISHTIDSAVGAKEFWKAQFTDLQAATFPQLPSPRYVPSPESSFKYELSAAESLNTEFTISTVIQLAWSILMSHYIDSEDVVFGLTVNGRNAPIPGIQDVTGPTIATFPLRARLRLESTVEANLASLRDQMTATIPFEQMGLQNIRELGTGAAAACDFQCHLAIQPPFVQVNPEFVVSESSLHENYSDFANYALVVICQLGKTGDNKITVDVSHDDKVISLATVKRMIQQFEHVLHQIWKSPELPLDKLDLICPQDRRQLSEWNIQLPLPYYVGLHDLVLEHAAQNTPVPAIEAWDGTVSYRELDHMSFGLAKRLHGMGVQRGSIIPLCLDRSKWVIISMLAILRTGGTCAPLDPNHPPERIKEIVGRTAAKLVLTESAYQHRFTDTEVTVLLIPEEEEEWEVWSEIRSLPKSNPSDAAFIVFTSGSTGKPKGILMDHTALCTSIRDHTTPLNIQAGVRGLHFASYAFDASLYEIFSVLVNGGCVCIPSETSRMTDLAGFINAFQVNWAVFTPSVLNTLLHPDQVPSLLTVVLGGEAISRDIVDIWASRLALINGYGPAETTICAAGQVPPQGWTTGTIGRTTGCVGWITTSSDPSRLAPIGAVGELVMEGPVVTRGYLDDPERTAEAYIPAPLWIEKFRDPSEAGRFYRTGDLMQYTDDGGIRFVGRKDSQVKLHGQRIELPDVEYHTAQAFPDVNEIVAEVVFRRGNRCDPILTVFIATQCRTNSYSDLFVGPNTEFIASAHTATVRLRSQLPRYLVPGLFLQVSHMPRTSSGKIDRRMLREQASVLSLDSFVAKRALLREPTTNSERILRDLWTDVLQVPVDEIATDDNFFDIGGDSVKAMRLCSLARPRKIYISLLDIFKYPTLSDLAKFAETSLHDAANDEYRPGSLLGVTDLTSFISSLPGRPMTFDPEEVVDLLPATEFQSSLLEDKNATYFSLPLPTDIDLTQLEGACRAMVAQNPSLRTVFTFHQGQYIQIILRQIKLPVTRLVCDDNASPEEFVESACTRDYADPLPLGAPQLRIYLITQAASRHWLLVRASHAQLDFVSAILFLKDISAIYEGRQRQPRGPSFAQYLQYRLLNRPKDALQFWESYLRGSEVTVLRAEKTAPPLFGPTPTNPMRVFKTIPFPATKEGITVATLTKAAWAFVLAELTGETDKSLGPV